MSKRPLLHICMNINISPVMTFLSLFLILLLMLDSPGDSYVLVPNIYVGKSPNKGLLVAIAL